ncbi:antitoxin Xre/MbcA/ParS toxin-binding domain-containing protein [Amnimonas aquatica]|uniref:antitoxin Xre/MbcA/ParS toxin-binding domain-containing protein n=1 Tax=Amnimonas aquatica TaxID=2094561 RepID=UPI003B96857D
MIVCRCAWSGLWLSCREPVLSLCRSAKPWAVEVFGSLEHAQAWLQAPLPVLGNRCPLDVVAEPGGSAELLATLGRIEHGVFS